LPKTATPALQTLEKKPELKSVESQIVVAKLPRVFDEAAVLAVRALRNSSAAVSKWVVFGNSTSC
jgi:hypothetical protein